MPDTVLTRRRLIAGGTGLTAGSIAALTTGATAAAGGGSHLSAEDILAINNLKANYAYGSDALAAGNEDEGRARYRAVFTSNAHVTSLPAIDAYGPEDLADQVLAIVGGAAATQHLLGTIEIVPLEPERGRGGSRAQAAITAYAQATIIATDGGLTRVLATYHDVAVQTRAGWRLSSSAATTLNVESVTPAG